MQTVIFAARPDEHDMKKRNGIWRPRLDKEKQQLASIIEDINDLLAEVLEHKRSLTMAHKIHVKGNRIILEPILDENQLKGDKEKQAKENEKKINNKQVQDDTKESKQDDEPESKDKTE